MMADFNFFLLQVAYRIKSNDLADMKFLCEGDDALPTGKLERIETPRELLNFLRKSGKIRPGEVMYLVNLLETVGLIQLAKRVKEMGKKSILLFSSATTFVAWSDVVMTNMEFLCLSLYLSTCSIVTFAYIFRLEHLITACSIQTLISQSSALCVSVQ